MFVLCVIVMIYYFLHNCLCISLSSQMNKLIQLQNHIKYVRLKLCTTRQGKFHFLWNPCSDILYVWAHDTTALTKPTISLYFNSILIKLHKQYINNKPFAADNYWYELSCDITFFKYACVVLLQLQTTRHTAQPRELI